MSQNDFSLSNADGATLRADANSAFQALASESSGTAAPSTTYAFQPWRDTTTNLKKERNAANNAWLTVGTQGTGGFVPYINGSPFASIASSGSVEDLITTGTNDSAGTGKLGQYKSDIRGTAVALSSGSAINIGTLVLEAGDWDARISAVYTGGTATALNYIRASISGTSGVSNISPGAFTSKFIGTAVSFGLNSLQTLELPDYRLSLAAAGTYFFVMEGGFTGGTLGAYGLFSARRPR